MAKQAPVSTEIFDSNVEKSTGPSTGMALTMLAIGSGTVWAVVGWLALTLLRH